MWSVKSQSLKEPNPRPFRIHYSYTLDTTKPRITARPLMWSVKRDSNPRPSGPKPDALPSCAIHRDCSKIYVLERMRILRISLTDASHLMIFP